ncbi:MAG TPA: TolC family protein [Longimicrobiales bacterium]|nr:TolC family protein [Longimicrobiales bacterium]
MYVAVIAVLLWARADAAQLSLRREPPDSGPAVLLTRRQAIEEAIQHNPQLEAAREEVGQARARVVQATALPDPSLSGSLEDQSGVLAPRSAGTRGLGLGLSIPFPDKIRLRGKVAGADVRAAQLSVTQLEQVIGAQTAQSYDALLVAQRHVRDLTDARDLANDFVKKTQARYEGGTAAKLDVIKAKVDASQVQNDLISAERDIANARVALNRLLGRAPGGSVEPADTLAPPPPLPALEGLRLRAASNRPEVRTLVAQRQGARAATSLAREFWVPDLDIGVVRNHSPGSAAAFETDVGIGFPLFFWQHGRGEVAEASHRERELAATARDMSAQVEQEVRSAYADAETALRQVAHIRDELLPEAQEAYRIASVSYGLGGSSALDVLDAKRALIDAQSQLAEALGAANDAMAQLELAVGGPLQPTPSAGDSHDR